jgi:hypothetical protein
VSRRGDNESEMSPTGLLDDETIEAIVEGEAVDARFDHLAAFARDVRALGDDPVPPASPALQSVLAGDPRPRLLRRRRGRGVLRHRGRLTTAAAKVAGLGVVAQIGLGTSVAAAGVIAAGAGGVLPDRASRGVRDAIEAVTPVDFGSPGSEEPADPGEPERFGDRVSSDATGESDGEPGVDGREISDQAPGAEHRPDDPGRANDHPGQGPASGRDEPVPGPGDAGGSDGEDDQGDSPSVSSTPEVTAPGATAPGRVRDETTITSSTSSMPSPTQAERNAGGGTTTTAQVG